MEEKSTFHNYNYLTTNLIHLCTKYLDNKEQIRVKQINQYWFKVCEQKLVVNLDIKPELFSKYKPDIISYFKKKQEGIKKLVLCFNNEQFSNLQDSNLNFYELTNLTSFKGVSGNPNYVFENWTYSLPKLFSSSWKNLKSLYLIDLYFVNDFILKSISFLEQLTFLKLYDLPSKSIKSTDYYAISKCTQLERITFKNIEIDDLGMQKIITSCSNLTAIIIQRCSLLTKEGFKDLKHIKDTLSSFEVYLKEHDNLVEYLSPCCRLRELGFALYRNEINSKTMNKVVSNFRFLKRLKFTIIHKIGQYYSEDPYIHYSKDNPNNIFLILKEFSKLKKLQILSIELGYSGLLPCCSLKEKENTKENFIPLEKETVIYLDLLSSFKNLSNLKKFSITTIRDCPYKICNQNFGISATSKTKGRSIEYWFKEPSYKKWKEEQIPSSYYRDLFFTSIQKAREILYTQRDLYELKLKQEE